MKSALRILYLEDDPNDAELVKRSLKTEGLLEKLVCVDTRTKFLSALKRDEWDVILADYALPLFSGMEALAIAREKVPEVPFVFLSGSMGEEVAIESLKAGATDYVLKQNLSRLVPAVRRAFREAQEHAEREEAERALQRKMRELARFQSLATDRELRMIDLKREVNELATECKKTPRYDVSFVGAD